MNREDVQPPPITRRVTRVVIIAPTRGRNPNSMSGRSGVITGGHRPCQGSQRGGWHGERQAGAEWSSPYERAQQDGEGRAAAEVQQVIIAPTRGRNSMM